MRLLAVCQNARAVCQGTPQRTQLCSSTHFHASAATSHQFTHSPTHASPTINTPIHLLMHPPFLTTHPTANLSTPLFQPLMHSHIHLYLCINTPIHSLMLPSIYLPPPPPPTHQLSLPATHHPVYRLSIPPIYPPTHLFNHLPIIH